MFADMPKNKLKTRVFVAMSGGVDSSVAAALLKKAGLDVHGIHIKMWSDPSVPCLFKEDRLEAMRAAAHLGIPFETWDLTKEYRKAVVDYMIREYKAGHTPNPDVMCNKEIKFGVFLKRALERGADFVATGHYVRLRRKFQIPNSKFQIFRAKDVNKDQSYFLWTLTQNQLRHCLFPVGDYTKPQVRKLAKKLGLPNAEKKDSQGICFIGEIDVREFLKKFIPSRPGIIRTTKGKVIGKHEGLAFYTIGQRQGLGIGGGIPYYVAAKDFKKNELIVAVGPYDEKLFSKELTATDINWISGKEPKFPLKCKARIRYRQPLQNCRVKKTGKRIKVIFTKLQRAVTPGQSIVFYKGQEMLGGGVIE